MCQPSAAINRLALPTGILLWISVVACLGLAGFSLPSQGCEHASSASRAGGCERFSPTATRLAMRGVRVIVVPRACLTSHRSFEFGSTTLPENANRAADPPSLSSGCGIPQTDGLDEQHPPQVRGEPTRWGVVILGCGSKASQCGGALNRRSTCHATRLRLPPLSVQKVYCTWVI